MFKKLIRRVLFSSLVLCIGGTLFGSKDTVKNSSFSSKSSCLEEQVSQRLLKICKQNPKDATKLIVENEKNIPKVERALRFLKLTYVYDKNILDMSDQEKQFVVEKYIKNVPKEIECKIGESHEVRDQIEELYIKGLFAYNDFWGKK